MVLWQALVLGVVQGFTEFLPVSSSGHLVLVERLLGVELPGLTFEIAVHAGTLLAVIWVYADDIRRMIAGFLRLDFRHDPDARLALYVILATLPTAAMGLLLKPLIGQLFESVLAVGFFLIVTGLLLWVAERLSYRTGNREIGVPGALFIGVMQGLALAPGLSRSGTTIAAGLLAGLRRVEAARFSFLLSLPAVGGATLLDLLDSGVAGAGVAPAPLLAGAAAAAVTGFVAIKVLLRLIAARRLRLFAYYVWVLGLLAIYFGS